MRKIFQKFILTVIVLVSFVPSCFAVSNIEINNVTKKEVIDKFLYIITQSGLNFALESVNDYGLTLIGSKSVSNIFGGQAATQQNKVNLTLVETGNNVIATFSETAYLYYNNGRIEMHPINDVVTEKTMLVVLKQQFNDYYLFGYETTDNKKDGGLVIGNVDIDSPFGERGIKAGDVMISIDGKKVTKYRKEFAHGLLHDKFQPTTCKFVIKRDGTEKIYTITSKLHKSDYTLEKEKQAQANQNTNI